MAQGYVYIFTNPCLDGWVKIGRTDRDGIEARLNELNSPSNLPLSYRCYAVYEVDDTKLIEDNIHNLIDVIDPTLHAREQLPNGRTRKREFFKMSPEAAFGVFKSVAILRNEKDNLKPYVPTETELQEEEIVERRTKRPNNSFQLLGIPTETEIAFLLDDAMTATVRDHRNTVVYQGEKYSVSGLARKLLIEHYGWSNNSNVNGWRYFTRDGITLSDLREIVESQEIESE